MTIEEFARRLRDEFKLSMSGAPVLPTRRSWDGIPKHRREAWVDLARRVVDLVEDSEIEEKA